MLYLLTNPDVSLLEMPLFVFLFSLLSYFYETLAAVKQALKENDAKYSEFGMGMNNLRLNCINTSS